jgi:CDP-diacylglycerol--glycerol-3-phosphate 3-phosphatidyltransferase
MISRNKRLSLRPADMISISRVLLLPALLYAEIKVLPLLSLVVIIIVIATDVLDGRVARACGTACSMGAILDMTADFAVVFITYMTLWLEKQMNAGPVVMVIVSFTVYASSLCISNKIAPNRLGKYAGASCYTGILVFFILRITAPGILGIASVIISIAVCSFLAVSTAETIIELARSNTR